MDKNHNAFIKYNIVNMLTGLLVSGITYAASSPCEGPYAMLSIVNRPTVADSACVVPYKHISMEGGFQLQQLYQSSANSISFPEPTLRFGLPENSEFIAILPNYIHQSTPPFSGNTATTLGVKYELNYSDNWVLTFETLFTLPSGSIDFGSQHVGTAFNGILSYGLSSDVSIEIMLGYTNLSQSINAGGQRYSSINPDLVLSYQPTKKVTFFAEVYGQSNTGTNSGSGSNTDVGLIYLLSNNLTVDLEVGQHINGNLGGFERYIGAGLGFML